MSNGVVFAGEVDRFGDLSNEHELVENCPEEFFRRNDWSTYAEKIFFKGALKSNWKWKTSDESEKKKQMEIFIAFMVSMNLDHNEKMAVCGWMLSEMLEEVPEWIAPQC